MSIVDNPDVTDLGSGDFCASAQLSLAKPVLEKIADKWTILILTVISTEPRRFNEIKRRLDGISHKALSEALKRLERNGLVTRTVLPTSPVGVEYAITALGRSLKQPFDALCAWALMHRVEIADAVAKYEKAGAAP